jgi:hypothetical protein
MDKLKFINKQMEVLAVPYEFGEWTADIKYPYCVGEFTEEEPMTEDGAEQSTCLITVFHRGLYVDMEIIKEKIRKHFPAVHGLRGQTDNGAIAVYYGGAFYIPSGEKDLKKMQINLNIKEWKGDL